MNQRIATIVAAIAMGTALCAATPTPSSSADVKSGVDAWTRGDYGIAVRSWRPLAEAGDADAQFNMGQAYKLGRGVNADLDEAISWFGKAAAQGHIRAQDNYGLLLFQQGKREQAMPYLQKSAGRGEARAQYLYGTALFNGEFVGKDWVRAYAMMNRASAAGLPQASTSLAQMDMYIPAEQRARGMQLSAEMAKQDRATAVASALDGGSDTGKPKAAKPQPKPEPARPTLATASPTLEAPIPAPLTTPKATPPAKQASAASAKPAPTPVPASTPAKTTPAPVKTAAGPWRIQLGAFSTAARADAQWKTLSAKGAVSGLQRFVETEGGVTRLQAGPFRDQDQAAAACRTVKAAGGDCLARKIS